ncbi:MAG TPA: hypothetical protein IAA21_12250 [Candidatus Blautia faecigallinarum]|uniref:Transposase, YhgA-like n=1 Tax=Candidatus Blautia faecigallinarum TaxID=2838488 RepID=A0A9D2DUX2_9FIRM|nr:hypothetical protein [Candidatus Blautia faecigallinarum]
MEKKHKSYEQKPHVKKRYNSSLTPDKGTHVQRIHKDTLFRFIFRDKTNLLQLYNALNGSDYQDEKQLTITTLENVIYLGYKNDVSFLLESVLFLAEHQSTWNPNMPLRGVFYFARLYQDFVTENGYDLYKTTLIRLPSPQYVVFYNGTEDRPEREILTLSASFMTVESAGDSLAIEPALECKALVLNINYGKNRWLMEKCRPLWEYSYFIHSIRENLKAGCSPHMAADLAVQHCPKEGILEDLLRKHRKEVVGMFLEEYDKELHERTIRREGWEDGQRNGQKNGLDQAFELTRCLLEADRLEDLRRSTKDKKFRQKLLKEYGILK